MPKAGVLVDVARGRVEKVFSENCLSVVAVVDGTIRHSLSKVVCSPLPDEGDGFEALLRSRVGASITPKFRHTHHDFAADVLLETVVIVDDASKLEPFFMGSSGSTVSGTETGVRYQPGCTTATKVRQTSIVSCLLSQQGTLQTTGNRVNISINNAILTKLGDYKLSGSDGTWEVDIEAKCLPRDFYIEYMTV